MEIFDVVASQTLHPTKFLLSFHFLYLLLLNKLPLLTCTNIPKTDVSHFHHPRCFACSKDCHDTFAMLDTTGNDKIAMNMVGTLFRALGQNPTEAEVAKVLNNPTADGIVLFHSSQYFTWYSHVCKPASPPVGL